MELLSLGYFFSRVVPSQSAYTAVRGLDMPPRDRWEVAGRMKHLVRFLLALGVRVGRSLLYKKG